MDAMKELIIDVIRGNGDAMWVIVFASITFFSVSYLSAAIFCVIRNANG